MGFNEVSHENVKENIIIDGNRLSSKVNGNSYQFGTLEIPRLSRLRSKVILDELTNEIKVSQIVGDARKIHEDPANNQALFQAASQFNLLEMAGPLKTPEDGVDSYIYDYTQGPACAVACGPGTIYRNYFVPVNNQIGQTFNNQINCLEDITNELECYGWKYQNGYAFFNEHEIQRIGEKISAMNDYEREELKGKLRVGIQWDTEVIYTHPTQIVSQIYCSALPLAYSHLKMEGFESLARIILEAAYEATLYSAMINLEKTGCNKVFLTLVGGGAFGNDMGWILTSMHKALVKFKNTPLDVSIVSYESNNPMIDNLIAAI